MASLQETRNESKVYPEDTRCGLGWFHPGWLQPLASKKSYVLLYGLIGASYFAHGSYYVATISTVEKRFKMSSRTTGIVSSGMDISSVVVCLFISYLGSRGHKPRWVASGTILVAISCFISLVPHLIYGAGSDALQLAGVVSNLTGLQSAHLCSANMTATSEVDACAEGDSTLTAAAIFFVSRVILGLGGSMYWTLGVAYLDDNVLKTKAPLLLSTVSFLRMLGPTVGFLLASYCLGKFVQPDLEVHVGVDDPRWIGAWWLGWIPFGFVLLFLGLLLAMFPRSLPRAAERRAAAQAPPPLERSFADFLATLRRLATNPVIVLNTFSVVSFIFGYIGYYTFMPKYMETQFRQSAARASLVTGSIGLVSTGLGLLVSGVVMTRFKPRARVVAGWNVGVECIEICARIAYVYIGCPVQDLHGAWSQSAQDASIGQKVWELTSSCNEACACAATINYSPICSLDGSTTFYSACHAACSAVSRLANGTTMYEDCACAGADGRGLEGACPVDCSNNFLLFLVIECLIRFLSATGRAGNTLIQFRCVRPEDKSLSIGLTEVLLSLLAFIPGPILYGWILDSSCLVWGESCGRSGNCWLYDGDSLRYVLNLTAAGFMACGTLLDVGVWYHVKNLRIYDEDHEVQPAQRAAEIEPLRSNDERNEAQPANCAADSQPLRNNGVATQ